jgi:hypothetical protein
LAQKQEGGTFFTMSRGSVASDDNSLSKLEAPRGFPASLAVPNVRGTELQLNDSPFIKVEWYIYAARTPLPSKKKGEVIFLGNILSDEKKKVSYIVLTE